MAFEFIPLQQYRLIAVAPDEQNGVLSLNSSAVYAGQGLGAGLGSLVLGYSSPAALGYAGAGLAAVALIMLLLGTTPLPIRRATKPEATVKPFAGEPLAYEARPYSLRGNPSARSC